MPSPIVHICQDIFAHELLETTIGQSHCEYNHFHYETLLYICADVNSYIYITEPVDNDLLLISVNELYNFAKTMSEAFCRFYKAKQYVHIIHMEPVVTQASWIMSKIVTQMTGAITNNNSHNSCPHRHRQTTEQISASTLPRIVAPHFGHCIYRRVWCCEFTFSISNDTSQIVVGALGTELLPPF